MTTTRRSNFSAALRTTLLLAGLGGLLVVIGALIGGPQGALGFLVFALLLNFVSYWFSDKIALRAMHGAQPLSREQARPGYHELVEELATRAGHAQAKGVPAPREQPTPSPRAAPQPPAVAVTAGIRNRSRRMSCGAFSRTSSATSATGHR